MCARGLVARERLSVFGAQQDERTNRFAGIDQWDDDGGAAGMGIGQHAGERAPALAEHFYDFGLLAFQHVLGDRAGEGNRLANGRCHAAGGRYHDNRLCARLHAFHEAAIRVGCFQCALRDLVDDVADREGGCDGFHGTSQGRLFAFAALRFGARTLSSLEQPRIVGGDGGTAGEIFGKDDVVFAVKALAFRRDEDHDAEARAACDERHCHCRAQAEAANCIATLRIRNDGDNHFVADLADELGSAGAIDVVSAAGLVAIGRIAPVQIQRECDPAGIGRRNFRDVERAFRVRHVHDAPVGHARHGQTHQAGEGFAIFECAGERAARISEELQTLAVAVEPAGL